MTSGGSAASDAARRARSLAQLAGCEPTPSIELLCSLGMSEHGEAELKVLNPLLSDQECSKALTELTSLLLTISRAQHLCKALVLARRLHTALSSLSMQAAAGGKSPASAIHAAADANALADQLAALLTTQRAHIKAPGSTP